MILFQQEEKQDLENRLLKNTFDRYKYFIKDFNIRIQDMLDLKRGFFVPESIMTFAFEYLQATVNSKFACELYLLFTIEKFDQKNHIIKEKFMNKWPDFVIQKWVKKSDSPVEKIAICFRHR